MSPYQHCNQHPHHCSMQTLLIEAPPYPRPQRCEMSRTLAFPRPTCSELRALLHLCIPRPHNKCVCVCMCVCVRVSIQDQSVAMKLRLSLSRTHMHERPFPAEERGRQGQNRTCLNKWVWREHARMRARVRPGVPGAGSVAGPACTAAAPSTHFLFLLSKSWTNSGTSSCSCSAGSLHRKRKRRSRKEEPLFSGHST